MIVVWRLKAFPFTGDRPISCMEVGSRYIVVNLTLEAVDVVLRGVGSDSCHFKAWASMWPAMSGEIRAMAELVDGKQVFYIVSRNFAQTRNLPLHVKAAPPAGEVLEISLTN